MSKVFKPVLDYAEIPYSSEDRLAIKNRRIYSPKEIVIHAGDINSTYIEFETNRYENGVDISSQSVRIRVLVYYDNEKYVDHAVKNVKVNDNKIRFGFLLNKLCVENSGTITIRPIVKNKDETYILKLGEFTINVFD